MAADQTTTRLSDRARYLALMAALKSERSSFDKHWRELGDFLVPQRTRFYVNDRNRDNRRNDKIIDSTARFAARTLSSGLHAGLTSPARPWMKLTTHNPELAQRPDVKKWLAHVTQVLLAVFQGSNLYNALPLVYLDMGIFGTGATSLIEDEDVMRCTAYPIGSYVMAQDRRGKVSTFMREYQLTVEQLVEEFGLQEDGRTVDWSNISTAVRNAYDRGNYTQAVNVGWVVERNRFYDKTRKLAKFKKFASCYYEVDGDHGQLLRESGFDSFPIMAPRWDITGEDTYGTDSPGMTALGDVKQLQSMSRRKGQLIEKAVNPPLSGPTSLRTQKTSLLPGDVTYVDVRDGQQGLKPIQEVRLEGLQFMLGDMREVRQLIRRSFFEDLFLMLSASEQNPDGGTQPITAREVDERHEEKLLALGPVLERTNDELLNPIVDRAYELADKAGMIPRAPQALEGVDLKVQYTSVLAIAQKLTGVIAQDRFLQSTGAMAQLWPEVRHKVDALQAVDNYADMLDVDPNLVRTNEDARAMLAAEQQQQQQASAAEQAGQVAKAAKDASQTPVTGDSLLARVVASQGSGVPPAPVGQPPATPAGV